VVASGSFSNGAADITAPLAINRGVSPDGAYSALKIGIAPVDSDGVRMGPYDLNVGGSSDHTSIMSATAQPVTEVRYGRLKISNAYGSELLGLPVPLLVQYWNGTGWVTNTDDNLTALATPANGSGLVFHLASSGSTTATLNNPLANGDAGLTLTKPGSGHAGYVDITIASPAWLDYDWKGAGDTDPTARATFGIYKSKWIYLRENY
jgi:MSHA biogenesis protein MshQ